MTTNHPDAPSSSQAEVIAKLQYFHKSGCEKRTPNLIMAPRPGWPEDAVPVMRYRVEGDRPHICTCGLDDALALLTAATPEKEPLYRKCSNCAGTGFVHDDDGIEDNCHECDTVGFVLTAAPLPSAQEKADGLTATEQKCPDCNGTGSVYYGREVMDGCDRCEATGIVPLQPPQARSSSSTPPTRLMRAEKPRCRTAYSQEQP